jgi:hypothetical protein
MKHDPDEEIRRYVAELAAPYVAPDRPPFPLAGTATPRRDKYLARLTPLADRLAVALAKFPRDVIADGLHMDQLWPLVLGRQREKPRAFEVAAALREIGWTRVRFYSDSGPSQTAWFPPAVSKEDAKQVLKARKA